MPPTEPDTETSGDQHLTGRPVSAYLGAGEAVDVILTNTRVGVAREDADGTHRTEPGRDCGAVAVLTNRRALFVVGHPDGDRSSSVPYVEFTDVETRTETLTGTLVVETAMGASWKFTVRDPTDLDAALSHLASAVPARLLAQAREYRAEAESVADRERRIERLEASLDALRRATTVVDQPDVETGTMREDAEAVIVELVDVRLSRARECRSVGNWTAEAGQAADAIDHYDDARACFERALELVRNFPPGDAAAVQAEYDDLVEKRDAIEVSASVSSALD